MEPLSDDIQFTLDNLRAWRSSFQKQADVNNNVGAAAWVRVLDSLLNDPTACAAWVKLPNATEQAAFLAHRITKGLDDELRYRKILG